LRFPAFHWEFVKNLGVPLPTNSSPSLLNCRDVWRTNILGSPALRDAPRAAAGASSAGCLARGAYDFAPAGGYRAPEGHGGGCTPHFCAPPTNLPFLRNPPFITFSLAMLYKIRLRHLSIFSSPKMERAKIKTPLYLQASRGTRPKSGLSQIKLMGRKKILNFFTGAFMRNHWQISEK
jgi:hypothetical protein